jgi:hypothetical protein
VGDPAREEGVIQQTEALDADPHFQPKEKKQ